MTDTPPSASDSLAVRDVVQVTSEDHHWFGALLVVSEVTPRRIMAFHSFPGQGEAYIFVQPGEVTRIGRSPLELSEEVTT